MKRGIGLLVLIVIALPMQAQLLWKISGNGLAESSYLMGTHHLGSLSIKDSIAGMQQALNDTKQVYGEVDMSEIEGTNAQQLMLKAVMIDNDTTLQSLFTPEDYERIKQYYKENLLGDMDQMPKVKPSFFTNNLSVALYLKNIGGFDPQNQLDSYFQTQARADGKRTGGLETTEFQFDLLYNSGSLMRQAEVLLCFLNNIEYTIEQQWKLTFYYETQDLEAMYALSEEKMGNSCDPLPGEMEDFLNNRNKDWVTKIPKIMESDPTFIAVGALHLPGNNGLINLLRQEGYQVEPVK